MKLSEGLEIGYINVDWLTLHSRETLIERQWVESVTRQTMGWDRVTRGTDYTHNVPIWLHTQWLTTHTMSQSTMTATDNHYRYNHHRQWLDRQWLDRRWQERVTRETIGWDRVTRGTMGLEAMGWEAMGWDRIERQWVGLDCLQALTTDTITFTTDTITLTTDTITQSTWPLETMTRNTMTETQWVERQRQERMPRDTTQGFESVSVVDRV